MILSYEQEYNRNLSFLSDKYNFDEEANIRLRTDNVQKFSSILKGLYIFKEEISKYIESNEKI